MCNKCWETSHKVEAAYKPTSDEEISTSSVHDDVQNLTQRRDSHDVTVVTNDVNQPITSPRSQSSLESCKYNWKRLVAVARDGCREDMGKP